MPRKTPDIMITEVFSESGQTLEEARRQSLPFIIPQLKKMIEKCLDDGTLVWDTFKKEIRPYQTGDDALISAYRENKKRIEKEAQEASAKEYEIERAENEGKHSILKAVSWLGEDSFTYTLIELICGVADNKGVQVHRKVFYNEYGHVDTVRWSILQNGDVIYTEEFSGREGKTENWKGYKALKKMLEFIQSLP